MQFPQGSFNLLESLKNKYDSVKYQLSIEKKWKHFRFESDVISRLKADLKQGLHTAYLLPPLDNQESEVVGRIQQMTSLHNRNNVTRTEAYRDLYLRTPELHWALLAHMVSRNGGWSMTDLKGELLTCLLTEEHVHALFRFFERCNALIFQDAYPQLLLYEESKKRQRNLFHLLPAFNVSRFMQPLWNEFWLRAESALLTVGLIINEQSYIEKRVIQQRHYAARVYDTLPFRLQSVMQLTQIVFPFYANQIGDAPTIGGNGDASAAAPPRLAGVVAESFPNLDERIGIGKVLYSILFGIPEVTAGVLQFVKETPHTGSREDYWKQLFTSKRPHGREYLNRRLVAGRLQTGAPRLYSPRLEAVWPDVQFIPPNRSDWFTNLRAVDYAASLKAPLWFDMTERYCHGLNRLEAAALASQHLRLKFGK